MKTAVIKVGTGILNVIYSLFGAFPQKNRIVFMSRQSDHPSYDIRSLAGFCEEKGAETMILCRKMGPGAAGAISYGFHVIKQLFCMATSKVVVLDSYCIAACIAKHRESVKVVQMWHALGAMKKFSRSILDMKEGHSSRLADAMHMHENYDYIFTSSEASRGAFAEAFGYPPERLTIMSLPRVDAILDKERDGRIRKEILETYPQLGEKEIILYAPTLRKNFDMTEAAESFIDAVDFDRFDLVIKMHPLTEGNIDTKEAVVDRKFSTMDMFCVCDYVVTDYSAITYEAALKGLPLFFYDFDIDEYEGERSFYLDYKSEMPGFMSGDAEELVEAIKNGEYDKGRIKAFADKYIQKQERCTEEIGDLLMSLLD